MMSLTEGAGFKEMDAILRELPRSTAIGVSRRAMKKALAPVAEAARGGAPSTREAASVNISTKLTPAQARGNPNRDADTVLNMFVGSKSPLAHLFEFGTGPRFHKSGKFVGVMSPRPYMRAAWDGNSAKVLEVLRAELAVEIGKTLARAAKRAAKAGGA